MSTASLGISLAQVQQSTQLNIRGLENHGSPKKTSAKSSESMDTVSLSSDAQKQYEINGQQVSQAEFNKYDTDGNGSISSNELAAYKADNDSDRDSNQAKLIQSLQDQDADRDDASADMYSQFGNVKTAGGSGIRINATA